MTHRITLPRIGTAAAWRDAARGLLAAGVAPGDVTWGNTTDPAGLFETSGPLPQGGAVTLPRSFVALAQSVVWHRDPARFALLYAFAWRLRRASDRSIGGSALMADRGDPGLARLRAMEKNVHRCQHKMKAFVRFREIGDPQAQRRAFAAWFEPTHHTVEPTAGFFQRRFADMDWRIVTSDITAVFEDGHLSFLEDQANPGLPDDANEALWLTYFRNIFNPARLKVQAMQSEMPKKYWKNLPEAAAIPDLIANAPARARAMAEAFPTLPPARMARAQDQQRQFASVWANDADARRAALQGCTRCPLHRTATQAVCGEGPVRADLMIVGEQPGDREDLEGRVFVGPAGQMFDEIAGSVGLDRRSVYITNAVKHFKFISRGKRRLHQRPDSTEILRCRPWLDQEIAQIAPRLIVAMGATAAEALTGSGKDLLARCGTVEQSAGSLPVLITLHPAYLLRAPAGPSCERAHHILTRDLRQAVEFIGGAE